MDKNTRFEGFGANHTAGMWAELLDIPLYIFRYYVESEKLTVEDIYRRYGYLYQAPAEKERKPRQGSRMAETQQRIHLLLVLSGYVEARPGDIVVKAIDKNGNHRVDYQRRLLGVYNYRDGTLRLKNGEGLPLRELEAAEVDAMIQRAPDGFWVLHPDTRRMLSHRAVGASEREVTQAEYDLIAAKNPTSEKAGRGKQLEACGERHNTTVWAQKLGVSRATLWRHLKTQTLEEFIEARRDKQ